MKAQKIISLFFLLAMLVGCNSKADNMLRVSDINPRYFTDGSGKAVYLTGSHTWDNLVEMTIDPEQNTFDYNTYLKSLKFYHHNFFRLWAWDLLTLNTQGNMEKNSRLLFVFPQPWLRTGPGKALDGKPKFDLTKFNIEYFNRLKIRVEAAQNQDIYVSVMLFEGWGLQFSPGSFINHPFHPANNINQSVPESLNDSLKLEIYELKHEKVTRLQEEYVRKVIETVGGFDNVLYEISNENHPASTDWQYHMIHFIKEVELETGKPHPVGMTFQYKGGNNETLFNSPADWISPNREGGYRDNPPESTGAKVIIADTDHLGGIWGNRQWVWKSFLRGMNPIFMDPYKGKVFEKGAGSEWAEEVRIALGHTRRFAEKIDLINTIPAGNLASSCYCLANKGKEYLVYIHEGKETQIDLSSTDGKFSVEWFNPLNGTIEKGEDVNGNQKVELGSPFDAEEAIVYLKLK